jgi:hypothetical protein
MEYQRLKNNESLKLYLGKDGNGRYSFEFNGQYTPTKLMGSEVISVGQTRNGNVVSLVFSLENPDLLEYFCTFCEDLVSSVAEICDDNAAYRTLSARYLSWKKMFRPNHSTLNEYEVMGLIGELLYLRDILFPKYGYGKSLESWTGPEYTHKDFSLDDTWYEIKTVSSGKTSVKISSLEQLDSEEDGILAIYELEKMSPSYNGIKLNLLVAEILSDISQTSLKEMFMSKLSLFEYDMSVEYDNYVYSLKTLGQYIVNDTFPRLTRLNIPASIQRVQYEITLSEIESYKI